MTGRGNGKRSWSSNGSNEYETGHPDDVSMERLVRVTSMVRSLPRAACICKPCAKDYFQLFSMKSKTSGALLWDKTLVLQSQHLHVF